MTKGWRKRRHWEAEDTGKGPEEPGRGLMLEDEEELSIGSYGENAIIKGGCFPASCSLITELLMMLLFQNQQRLVYGFTFCADNQVPVMTCPQQGYQVRRNKDVPPRNLNSAANQFFFLPTPFYLVRQNTLSAAYTAELLGFWDVSETFAETMRSRLLFKQDRERHCLVKKKKKKKTIRLDTTEILQFNIQMTFKGSFQLK